jgi:hypothetical protein
LQIFYPEFGSQQELAAPPEIDNWNDPEFGSQEAFGTPLQVYDWNELRLTRELAISAKRKLTCCFCFTCELCIGLDRRRSCEYIQKGSCKNFALLHIGPKG